MTTLHILADPSNPVNQNIRTNPFPWACYKFISHMSSYGWNCIHYGVPGCDVLCETVLCLEHISKDGEYNTKLYNQKAGEEIAKRKNPGDIIVCFYGCENREACTVNPELKAIEPSIGYDVNAVWAPYKVFVSYSHMHYYYGLKQMMMEPSWFDAVIYNAITASEFEFNNAKKDYFLLFGRIISSKGVDIAVQVTEKVGKKLVIAGPGDLSAMGYNTIPKHVEVLGPCNPEQRKTLMSNAKAIFGPTTYIEPFGNMIAEAAMCGTPAITSDWGGFTENVLQGETGFRCKDFSDFVNAVENIDSIKAENCRNFAVSKFEDSVVHPQFDKYFKKIVHCDWYKI